MLAANTISCAIDPNSTDCNLGASAVQQMDSVYQSAPANIQAQFQSAHDSLMTQFNAVYSWYSSYIPFNPDCSTICQLGQSANQLQSQIQAAMGQVPSQFGSGGGLDIGGLGSTLLWIGAAYLALVYLSSHGAK